MERFKKNSRAAPPGCGAQDWVLVPLFFQMSRTPLCRGDSRLKRQKQRFPFLSLPPPVFARLPAARRSSQARISAPMRAGCGPAERNAPRGSAPRRKKRININKKKKRRKGKRKGKKKRKKKNFAGRPRFCQHPAGAVRWLRAGCSEETHAWVAQGLRALLLFLR